MTKTRAVIKHLWPSLSLLLALAALILLAWYPPPFQQFADTAKFALMLIVVASLIGPAMTGLVYKQDKRGLKFDLSVIIIIQLVAVGWGAIALYKNRPYFMVFTADRFEVLSARDVDLSYIEDERFLDKPMSGPILLYASMPADPQAIQKLIREVMFEGKPDLQFRTEFWSLYGDKKALAISPSKPLNELRIMRPEAVKAIDKLVKKHGADINKLKFVPGMHQYGQFAAILDADSGELIDTLVVNPWVD